MIDVFPRLLEMWCLENCAESETTMNHPYADLFPLLEGDKLNEFAEDIRKNGLLQPIIKDQQGRIVDGRNRLMACEMVGVKPTFETKEFKDDTEVLDYVVSANYYRRQLDESERGMVAAKLANMKVGGDRKSEKYQSANLHSDSHASPPPLSTPQPVSIKDAAKILNVGKRTVNHGKKIIKEGIPELEQAVHKKVLPISTASKVAGLSKEEQKEVLTSPEPRKAAKEKIREVEKTRPKPDRQKNGKRMPQPKGSEIMMQDSDNVVRATLNKLKSLGKVSRKQFLRNIPDASGRDWFMGLVSEAGTLPPMKIVEEDDSMELVIDESTADLCTRIKEKLKLAHGEVSKYNRFKFDAARIKSVIQSLYDEVANGAISSPMTKAEM